MRGWEYHMPLLCYGLVKHLRRNSLSQMDGTAEGWDLKAGWKLLLSSCIALPRYLSSFTPAVQKASL